MSIDEATPLPLTRWWGTYRLRPEQVGYWRIGPLALWVRHRAGEWSVSSKYEEDPLDASCEVDVASEREVEGSCTRFGVADDSDELTLQPVVADRAFIARPEDPLVLPARERLTVYLGTTVWLRLMVAGNRLLKELPLYRPSDTWFGPNTREGELCYASRTFCRMRREDLLVLPHRATTAVQINNLADEPLPLDRIKLPVPNLSLFHSQRNRLWTQDVSYERRTVGDTVAARFGRRAPDHVLDAQEVSPPRISGSDNVMIRAFTTLFGRGLHG